MAFAEHGLGKSLSDVFARTQRKDAVGRGFLELDITALIPPGENPRQQFDAAALDELTESVRIHGVLQPIVVLKRENGYEIISGERRFRAAKKAGLLKVPVVVRDGDDPQHIAELRLIENIQRENLNPVELAHAYNALLEQHGLTHEALSERVSKERSSITNVLRLLTLPQQVQDEVVAGTISMGHAKVLLGVMNGGFQLELARRVIEEQCSVRELERLVKAGPVGATVAPTPVAAPGLDIDASRRRELEENLYRLLGTRVEIKERGKKGTLTLHFAGQDQFQRLVSILERLVKQSNAG